MVRQKAKVWILLVVGAWLLAACGSSTAPPTASKPLPTQVGASTSTNASNTDSPVALTYNPKDGSLLRANSTGLFRWRSGEQWERVALLQTTSLSSVVVNPDKPDTVYVSGVGLGVVRSDDGGKNWQAVNTGLQSLDVTALALHSFQRETLFAWLKDDGIYRTENGGARWVRLPDQGPKDKDVRGLIHSTLPGSMNTGWLYASTPTGGYLSMDCF